MAALEAEDAPADWAARVAARWTAREAPIRALAALQVPKAPVTGGGCWYRTVVDLAPEDLPGEGPARDSWRRR